MPAGLRIFFAAVFFSLFVLTGCKDASNTAANVVKDQTFPELSISLDQALDQRLDTFEATFSNVIEADGKVADIFDFMPPKVLDALVKKSGVSRTALMAQMDLLWAQTLAQVDLRGFEISRDQTSILTAPSGRPYKILPTTTEMIIRANSADALATSETLALLDEGIWYIVRLDDAQTIKLFRQSFPDLNKIEIMKPIMTIDGEVVQP